MAIYKLCLIYSSNFSKPIFDGSFSLLEEIDTITSQFDSEEQFRNDTAIKNRIRLIKDTNYNYFSKISDNNKKRGKIGIINFEKDKTSYITPLYKNNNSIKSPTKLVKVINSTLKKENDGNFLATFLNSFMPFFNTEHNRVYGIYKLKNSLWYVKTPTTKQEIWQYKKTLELINITLNHYLDKDNDKMSEEIYFELRKMFDAIKHSTHIKNLRISNHNKLSKTKINKEKSKDIVDLDGYRSLFIKAYNDSLANGEEPNLFVIYKDKYKDELDKLNWYIEGKRRK